MPLIFLQLFAIYVLTQRTIVRYTSSINRKHMNDRNGKGDRKMTKELKKAIEILENKGFCICNQFDGFFGTKSDEYELWKGEELVEDHLTAEDIIEKANEIQGSEEGTSKRENKTTFRHARDKHVYIDVIRNADNRYYMVQYIRHGFPEREAIYMESGVGRKRKIRVEKNTLLGILEDFERVEEA